MTSPTLLCVPVTVRDPESALADAEAARSHGADLVEYRVDEFFTGAVPDGPDAPASDEVRAILRIVAHSPLPCIVTCRPATREEGGYYEGPEEARLALFERLGTAFGDGERPPRFLDMELCRYDNGPDAQRRIHMAIHHPEQVRDISSSLILSMHDFGGRPHDLTRRLLKMREAPDAAVCKVAYRCRSIRDSLELLDLPRDLGKPTVAVGVGEFGLLSRILAPKFGQFLTFAALRPGAGTAPGQPTIRELVHTYHFRSIRPSTSVYGIIGWPLSHSLSPLIHNAAFHTSGIDAVYVPLLVPPEYEHFKATLHALIDHPTLDFRGCSVTIPHKEHLFRFASEQATLPAGSAVAQSAAAWSIDPSAAACGAANTLIIERDTRTNAPVRAVILNTDGPAAVECLSLRMGDLAPRKIGIVGAGGAARAIAASLMMTDASVVVFNRSRPRADRLVAELHQSVPRQRFAPGSVVAASMDELPGSCCDAYVNCTPVGMADGPDPEGCPIPVTELDGCDPETVIMDTVYNPLWTPLLRNADAAGMRTIDGLALFIRQAAAQFEAWTAQDAPIGLFELIAREALSRPMPQ